MTDILERLKAYRDQRTQLEDDAATEIKRLREIVHQIERLPPEEAEPWRIWANVYGDGELCGHWPTKDKADRVRGSGRTACIQFIEAKVTASMIERATTELRKMGIPLHPDNVRTALNAALGIEE